MNVNSVVVILSPLGLCALAGGAAVATGLRWSRLLRLMRSATRPDRRFDRWSERVRGFGVYVLGQGRLLRWPFSGLFHFLIFWGFLVLLTAIAEAIVEGLWLGFRWDLVPAAGPLSLLQDVFSVLVLAGVLLALVNRVVLHPPRFRGSHRRDAVLILTWIASLIVAMDLNYATRIAEHATESEASWRPFAAALSRLFTALPTGSEALVVLHGLFFWAHLVLVFSFLVYLGFSKHLHIVTAAPNVLFRNLRPLGALPTLDLEAENADHFGASRLEHFSWRDVLDLYSCTECGRCQTHCPAYNTGKPLSPKTLITDLRDVAYERLAGGFAHTTHAAHPVPPESATAARGGGHDRDVAAVMWATGADHETAEADLRGHFQPSWVSPSQVAAAAGDADDRPLIGGAIAEETLWSCTTCGACMDQCPVLIEHVPKIIDMRRSLVLEQGRMPKQAETALRAIESVANPYGLSQQTRADWAAAVGVPLLRDHPGAEYLYWVGCASSFDQHARTIAESVVRILQAAGIDVAILGTEEKCSGDPARRIGNEYLFQERARDNIETLRRYGVRKVIASCPHCFNTFANEYPDLGGTYEVVHHTQLISRLVAEGRITLDTPLDQTVTFHDSCYLGRWNSIFAPPREILERIPGLRLVEMSRNRNEGMCCGAGGGRMWMEETQPRVNHRRVRQAAETNAAAVATACPYCLAMFDEGVAAQGLEMRVDDVAVFVARAMSAAAPVGAISSPPADTASASEPAGPATASSSEHDPEGSGS